MVTDQRDKRDFVPEELFHIQLHTMELFFIETEDFLQIHLLMIGQRRF
jgi:hypothetical protein